jgi:signal transduction histidine kinase
VLGSLPLFGLLIGIFLSVLMSCSVTRPISQLAEATQAIGRHDLGYRVETKGSQELQELAQSFNRMAEELEHAELTRRNLMADVAHELRTPLAVLDGNLRAMLDGVHALNEEEIALLYEQTRHLNRLVDDLRELSLAEANQLSLNRQEVNLAGLVRETVAHFDLVTQEQGIQLTTDLDDPLFHPSLDENRIRQVLHNLLSNAFRYTSQGGKVVVRAKRSADQKALEISIADSGAGIPPEELMHIFDRFYRTEETVSRDRGGTGLGLAIVKAIVEAHGGSVNAQSGGRDQGSTFTIRFPA